MKIQPATEENIKKAAAIVRMGGVVIYPTETVYGLGCTPQIPEAAKRVCFLKGRADKPLPIACSDTEEARRIVEFNPANNEILCRVNDFPMVHLSNYEALTVNGTFRGTVNFLNR